MSLAYFVEGDGEPVIHMPFHHNQVIHRWNGPPWFRTLADHFQMIHYDSRGQGLSTRPLSQDPTVEDYRCDLETIIEASGLKRFALAGYGGFGYVAMRYAVDHPERVRALVMICSSVSFKAWTRSVFLNVAEENWEIYLDLQTRKFSPEVAARAKAWLASMSSQEDYVRMIRCFLSAPDAKEDLPRVSIPTLLIHSLDQHWLPPAEGAKVAAMIPDARILFTDGDFEPDPAQAYPAIIKFLQGVQAQDRIGPAPTQAVGVASPLSSRQLQVLRMLSEGNRTKEIADELVLSERTVERHIAAVYAKIGARNRSEATAFYLSRPDIVAAGAKYPTREREVTYPLV
jgi:pimeloyl-ACP methyl ester carboxylesterase/DNA-binding CsgD family transcriptional regulator